MPRRRQGPLPVKVVALAGGVGGARLVDGLAQACELTTIVNTGDDFDHWGLRICPDLDTVMYTLAGLANPKQGWGIQDETWGTFERVQAMGGEDWFRLGDRDLATHLTRTHWLRQGLPLSEVTRRLCKALGVTSRVLPMCEGARPTTVRTETGWLDFQTWLVRQRAPQAWEVRSEGDPEPAVGVVDAIETADLVVIAPSNPYVSVDSMLGLGGVRRAVGAARVVAVSPIVGGRAVKGPLAEMIPNLAGRPATAAAVRAHYGDLVDGFVLQHGDDAPGPVLHEEIIMGGREDRTRLARAVLAFGETL
ncbi:MAG: 2-phospho-L-lactate transferase [Proteobacteria bacterium]|nr:2-phospho-L-lactate transferase [Pseudomonadota bacterium]MCP4922128.1 2-phospho-L-lactate transferase [Pseudomonadota bacterium]